MKDTFQTDMAAINGIPSVPLILDVVCRTTGMGFAAVARVTESRWVACTVLDKIQFGLTSGSELKVKTTICDEIRQSKQPVIIDHVAKDDVYRDHATPAMYGFQSYISMPILLSDGTFFGTLCAIDPRPARVKTQEVIGMFRLFAELIATHIEAHGRMTLTESKLEEERKTSELREQFIAVLGHDLRSPLGAISSGAMLLERMNLPERPASVAGLIRDSASRMLGLIENLLDFARGRLGGGIQLESDDHESLEPTLRQIIAEATSSWPARELQVELQLSEPVRCDRIRIAQLFSNLLGNALIHGTADKPVKVQAATIHGMFTLSVSNSAPPILPETMKLLFTPFKRGEVKPHQQGLGLGLYIASEIASAHGGVIDAISTPQETRFTFNMPLKEAASIKKPSRKQHEAA